MLQPVAPDFKVDNFYAHRQGEYTFFLSHNHEDHLNGLTIKAGQSGYKVPRTDWCFGKIFASEDSAKILIARFPHLRSFTVPLRYFTEYEIKGRQVWLIPANHCPGAALFLIRNSQGKTILHTGDFRYRP